MLVKTIYALQGREESHAPGEVVDLDEKEARGLIAIGAVEEAEVPVAKSKPDAKSGKQTKAQD